MGRLGGRCTTLLVLAIAPALLVVSVLLKLF
jgi:hypothetical protein